MEQADFEKLLRRALVYYVAGAPEYQDAMNEVTIEATPEQWELVKPAFDEVREFLADSDIGPLHIKESVAARREGRKNRFPSAWMHLEEKQEAVAKLAEEYRQKGIKFTLPDRLDKPVP